VLVLLDVQPFARIGCTGLHGEEEMSALRLNVGCGQTPTPGWKNYDNSPSVWIAQRPLLARGVFRLGLLGTRNEFVETAQLAGIVWANAAVNIPEQDGTVEALYSSHFVEHLDRREILQYLREARRVLASGGVIRTALPDIRYHVDNYVLDGDADRFVTATRLAHDRPRTLKERLTFLLIGDRGHMWMYDGSSFARLLERMGFRDVLVVEPGSTSIPNPGELDLRERVPESVFIEARKP
jgi:hypothetical protein